jgi:hypothetical protein
MRRQHRILHPLCMAPTNRIDPQPFNSRRISEGAEGRFWITSDAESDRGPTSIV